LKFNRLHASVYDLDTNRLIGTGNYAKISLPAKSFPDILLPLNFTYVATNSSDQTCQFYLLSLLSNPLTFVDSDQNWYNGCKNKGLFSDGIRPCECFKPKDHLTVYLVLSCEIPSRRRYGYPRTTVIPRSIDTGHRRELSSRTPPERSLNIYDTSPGQLFGIFLLCIFWTLAHPRPSLILFPPYLFALRSSHAEIIITLILKDIVVVLLQNHTPAYCICFFSRRIVLKSFEGVAFFGNLVNHHCFDHNAQGRSESNHSSALFVALHPHLTLSLWNIGHLLLGLRRRAWVRMCDAVLAVL